MQTALTTSHWRTLQEMLLQKMESASDKQVSVLVAGMPFVAQGVSSMLQAAPWVRQVDIITPQDEETLSDLAPDADVLFLTTPGNSRLLAKLTARYFPEEQTTAMATEMLAGHTVSARVVREVRNAYPRIQYPDGVVAADNMLRGASRGRRRRQIEQGDRLAPLEDHDKATACPGLVLMHISGAVSLGDVLLSRRWGQPVSLHLRDGARTVRAGVFAASQGLTYCSAHAFASFPELFVPHRAAALWAEHYEVDGASGNARIAPNNAALAVADPSLWQMLSDESVHEND